MNAISQITPPVVDLNDIYNRLKDASTLVLNAKVAITSVVDQSGERLFEPGPAGSMAHRVNSMACLALDQIERADKVIEEVESDLPDGNTDLREQFDEWRRQRLAVCRFTGDDDEADALVAAERTAMIKFVEAPAMSADEVLLKLYALALTKHSCLVPMAIRAPDGTMDDDHVWRGIIADLPRMSDAVRRAIKSGEAA